MGQCDNIDFENDEAVGWTYCPSFPAAVLFASLFFILTVTHIIQAYTFRKKFCWVIIMGGAWEVAGFSLRALGHHMMRQLGVSVPQQILIILAPLWLNAFIYMVLGRMVYFFLPERRIWGITAKRLILIFVLLDVTAFIVQGASSSMMSADDPKIMKIGINVYMGGIGLQECFILIFTGLAIGFQRNMNEHEAVQPVSLPWRPLLYTLYAGLGLITIRIIYRMIEYSAGYDSNIAKAEAAFYVLDAVPMVIAMSLFSIFHPGRALVGPDSEFPKKEKKKKKKKKTESESNNTRDGADDDSPDSDANDVAEPRVDTLNGSSRRESRRSRRSRRSQRGGLMSGARNDPESGAYQELESVPLHHDIPFRDRSASVSPELQPPYPMH